MKRWAKKLLVPAVTVLLTVLANYCLNLVIEAKGHAVLSKEVIRTDLSSLPPELQRQIPFVPINYALQNRAGGPAQKVTITLVSDNLLAVADLKFSPDSEAHQIFSPDPHSIKIDVPTIRPQGTVGFQILTRPTNSVTFSELSENAKITTVTGVEPAKRKTLILEYCAGAVVLIIWAALIWAVINILMRSKESWQEMEAGVELPQLRERLIAVIVVLLLYNTVLSTFGPIGMWFPVPRIGFNDLSSAFMFYLLVTRYKLLENWLRSHTKPERRTESADSCAPQTQTDTNLLKTTLTLRTTGEKADHSGAPTAVAALGN